MQEKILLANISLWLLSVKYKKRNVCWVAQNCIDFYGERNPENSSADFPSCFWPKTPICYLLLASYIRVRRLPNLAAGDVVLKHVKWWVQVGCYENYARIACQRTFPFFFTEFSSLLHFHVDFFFSSIDFYKRIYFMKWARLVVIKCVV